MKGLPKDQLSIENSEILKFVKQVPLIIDPNGEALNWLRSKLAEEGTVESLTQQDPKFMNILEMGVRFGKTLLLQEIDYIEAVLTAVLKRDYTRQGARSMLQLNDKTFEVSDTFRLLLATRNSSI